jgi:phage tail tape-measure protein
MSEQEPKSSGEWEAIADKKYADIKEAIKKMEQKGSSQSVEKNIRDAARGFGDMMISLGGLTYSVASGVADKAKGEDAAKLQKDLAKKASAARDTIADEMEKAARKLRSEKKE